MRMLIKRSSQREWVRAASGTEHIGGYTVMRGQDCVKSYRSCSVCRDADGRKTSRACLDACHRDP
ncbi:MAG: hypothetical protein JWP47_3245 [Polaromonas sp.]|nr:hypothetical protein [Polaromonas sp.]